MVSEEEIKVVHCSFWIPLFHYTSVLVTNFMIHGLTQVTM